MSASLHMQHTGGEVGAARKEGHREVEPSSVQCTARRFVILVSLAVRYAGRPSIGLLEEGSKGFYREGVQQLFLWFPN